MSSDQRHVSFARTKLTEYACAPTARVRKFAGAPANGPCTSTPIAGVNGRAPSPTAAQLTAVRELRICYLFARVMVTFGLLR